MREREKERERGDSKREREREKERERGDSKREREREEIAREKERIE
jgi:hypothetical protein